MVHYGWIPYLSSLDEYVFEELSGDEAVRRRGVLCSGFPVETRVDGVQLGAELAADVEPPIAGQHGLLELRAVGTQERRLASVHVAVVPRLAASLRVREEARERLVVAVEVRVRHRRQDWVVRAWTTWNPTSIKHAAGHSYNSIIAFVQMLMLKYFKL